MDIALLKNQNGFMNLQPTKVEGVSYSVETFCDIGLGRLALAPVLEILPRG